MTTRPLTLNELWSGVIVDELSRWGVKDWFVSPGYRDAPLIAALVARSHLAKHVCIDERSGAFKALGCARASGRAVALLCTSGTAGANYFPAVIEASKDQVPLIVITADRPFPLIRSGANQVMEQAGLFGVHVRTQMNLPLPGPELSLAALAAHCGLLAEQALSFPRGPVQLNVALDEPLEPASDGSCPLLPELLEEAKALVARRLRAPARVSGEARALDPIISDWLLDKARRAARPLLVVGRLSPHRSYLQLERLARVLAWPVVYDIGCGLFAARAAEGSVCPEVPASFASLGRYAPDLILHIGRRAVAKQLDRLVVMHRPETYIIAGSDTDLADPTFVCDQRIICDEELVAGTLTAAGLAEKPAAVAFNLKARSLRATLDQAMTDIPFSFPALAAQILGEIPAYGVLVLANSMTVRAFDTWAYAPTAPGVSVVLQRGVSGIEGHVSQGIGIALGTGRPVTVVCGDIAFLHDLNAICDLQSVTSPLVVIVANNRGGGIFRHMPLGKFPEVHDPLITTPHNRDFAQLAAWAEVPYATVSDQQQLLAAYRPASRRVGPTLIECVLDDMTDARVSANLKTISGEKR